jgi:hypothetical protein
MLNVAYASEKKLDGWTKMSSLSFSHLIYLIGHVHFDREEDTQRTSEHIRHKWRKINDI